MKYNRRKNKEQFYDDDEEYDSYSPVDTGFIYKLKHLTYRPIALTTGIIASGLMIASLVFAILGGGDTALYLGLLCIGAGVLSLYGFLVTLYGHFIVKIEEKAGWLLPLLINLVPLALVIFVYILGLKS